MKIVHQKVDNAKMSLAERKKLHEGVRNALPRDEYCVITTPTELVLLDSDSKSLKELIEVEGAIYDIEDLIPEAIELYKMGYKSPPIGEDVDNLILQIISDFRESLEQGIKQSSTIIGRFLNESEEQYIIDILMDKGYRQPSFLNDKYTEGSITVETTRVQMCM